MHSPDQASFGFLSSQPEPLRYDYASPDPGDVPARLASLISTSGRVLDVGCGTGSLTRFIQERTGACVIGIEPDAERSKFARNSGLNVLHGYLDAEFLRENGPFDTIVFADVLEHLPDPGSVIQLARTGLSPGGAIVASVPNVAHWFVRTDLMRGRFRYRECGIMDATHLRWFTRESLHSFFANLGFVVDKHLYTVNSHMSEYQEAAPWRWMSAHARSRVIGALVKIGPNLFGCQHVVRAFPLQLQAVSLGP
ncbi:MAG: class I SAM-dependent methyltransferase [Acidobacteriota bacterium]